MQGDAVATDPVHLGTSPLLPPTLDLGVASHDAARDPLEYFTRGYESGDHREVLPRPFFLRGFGLTRILRRVVSLNVCFGSGFSFFVDCLQSLPNLRTLEIRWPDHDEFFEEPLWNALKRVNLPQIKTLTIPPTAHPLLRHCHELEDVDFVIVEGRTACSDVILRSLASNQKSKIRRLAIPLLFWNDLSRKWSSAPQRYKVEISIQHLTSEFVTACPKLTELTIVCIHPAQSNRLEPGFLAEPIRAVHPAMLELVRACRVLPNFDTFQIVYFPNFVPLQATSYRHGDVRVPMNTELPKQQRTARKEAKGVGDLLMECLKLAEMKATLRFIELESELSEPLYLDAVKVEEYEMQ